MQEKKEIYGHVFGNLESFICSLLLNFNNDKTFWWRCCYIFSCEILIWPFIDLMLARKHTHTGWHLQCADYISLVFCVCTLCKLDVHSFQPGAESLPCPSVSHSTLILTAQLPGQVVPYCCVCIKACLARGFGCVCQLNNSRFFGINQPTRNPSVCPRVTALKQLCLFLTQTSRKLTGTEEKYNNWTERAVCTAHGAQREYSCPIYLPLL